MSKYTVMIPSSTADVAIGSPPYTTIEDALRGASFMLGNGAAAAWIVDSRGSLLLRAEQVRSRLDSLEARNRSTDHATGLDKPRCQPTWLS